MARSLALLPVLLVLALGATAHAAAAPSGDPGPVLPLPGLGDPEAPPRPLGAVPAMGAPRAASPWRAPALPRPAGGLTRAVSDGGAFISRAPGLAGVAMDRGAQTGATVIRMPLYWSGVRRGHPLDDTDPGEAAYDFSRSDEMLRKAAARGLTPLLTVLSAPNLAEGPHRWRFAAPGTWAPDPAALGRFAVAAARRYSGAFPDPLHPGATLPRVRLWQAWNEPNLPKYLSPQWVGRGRRWRAWAPAHYRRMLNAFYDGVKSVDAGNVVVTAGLAPDGDTRDGAGRTAALRFWQALLCLGTPPRIALAPCPDPARFDVVAVHPLSIADPDTPASGLGVAIADLGKLKHLLAVARRTGRIDPRSGRRIWATELNWDSRLGSARAARLTTWIPRALYLLWRQGVDLVTWQLLRDPPAHPARPAGLYAIDPADPQNPLADRAKPALQAFTFPVTTVRLDRRRLEVWGLLPAAGPRAVAVQRRVAGRWRTVARVPVKPSGLVDAVVRVRGAATLRLAPPGGAPASGPVAAVARRR